MLGRYYFHWLLRVIAVTDHVTSVLPMMSSKFELVTSPRGEDLCSVDQPSAVLQMVCGDMVVTCGLECLKDGCCLMYQFKVNSFVCELFDYTTTNLSVIPGCASHRSTTRGGQPVSPRTYSPRYITDGSNGQCNITLRTQFRIVSDLNNKSIDIGGGGGNSGDPLVMMTPQTGKTSQMWYFDAQGFLRSAVNDYGIFGTATNGIELFVAPFNATTWNQQWKWLPAARWIINENINKCFDIKGAKTFDSAPIAPYSCGNFLNKLWSLA